jgi:hypothetical protein
MLARDYSSHRLPWFQLHDESLDAVSGTTSLAGVKSVKEVDAEKSSHPLQDDDPVDVGPLQKLWTAAAKAFGVRDGSW